MVALLALGTLQYHWVVQVSTGERERRQANLALGAERLQEDFDRELARVYLALQMDAATLRDENWSRYARRIDRWQDTAPYPGLVKDVYLVKVNQIGRVGIAQYNSATRGFESLVWPFELMPVRRRIERAYRAIFNQGSGVRADIAPVDRAGPSLLIPVSRPWLLSDQEAQGISADLIFSDLVFPGTFTRCVRCPPELYDTPLIAHTIVVLDREYIASTFLPALVERYFPTGGSFEYNIGVVDQSDAETLIFSSDERLDAASYGSGDASVGIFDITYEELNALMLASDPRLDGTQTGGRIAIGVLGQPSDGDSGASETSQWRLVLKHRQGSLEAAIEGLRVRNLLISFSTLLLLGGSMAMLLISTRRAQRLAKQQIDFASAVSHELRTPLAVILSAGENLADGVVHDPQKARRYGAVISNEGRRLTDMIEQVLAFAGAQSGSERYHMERCEIDAILEGAVAGLQTQLREGGYDLAMSVAPNIPPIYADAGALRRSLQNLISNAMKYGGEDGWIGIEAAVVAGDYAAELRISVRDHGAGIEPADLRHIFEPFYRGRNTRGLQSHGSGLGLSLVRHTIEAHGGVVSVDSRAGSGTCFTLALPLKDAGEMVVEAGATGSPSRLARL
jgi:signal transduction histidine kinase